MMVAMVEILLFRSGLVLLSLPYVQIYTAAFDACDISFKFQRDFHIFLLILLASRQDKGSDKQMDGVDHKLCN